MHNTHTRTLTIIEKSNTNQRYTFSVSYREETRDSMVEKINKKISDVTSKGGIIVTDVDEKRPGLYEW